MPLHFVQACYWPNPDVFIVNVRWNFSATFYVSHFLQRSLRNIPCRKWDKYLCFDILAILWSPLPSVPKFPQSKSNAATSLWKKKCSYKFDPYINPSNHTFLNGQNNTVPQKKSRSLVSFGHAYTPSRSCPAYVRPDSVRKSVSPRQVAQRTCGTFQVSAQVCQLTAPVDGPIVPILSGSGEVCTQDKLQEIKRYLVYLRMTPTADLHHSDNGGNHTTAFCPLI